MRAILFFAFLFGWTEFAGATSLFSFSPTTFPDRFNTVATALGRAARAEHDGCGKSTPIYCGYRIGAIYTSSVVAPDRMASVTAVSLRLLSQHEKDYDRADFIETADILIAVVRPQWSANKRKQLLVGLLSRLTPTRLSSRRSDGGIQFMVEARSGGMYFQAQIDPDSTPTIK